MNDQVFHATYKHWRDRGLSVNDALSLAELAYRRFLRDGWDAVEPEVRESLSRGRAA